MRVIRAEEMGMCFGVGGALVVIDAVRDPSCRDRFERAWPGDRGALKPPIVVEGGTELDTHYDNSNHERQ